MLSELSPAANQVVAPRILGIDRIDPVDAVDAVDAVVRNPAAAIDAAGIIAPRQRYLDIPRPLPGRPVGPAGCGCRPAARALPIDRTHEDHR